MTSELRVEVLEGTGVAGTGAGGVGGGAGARGAEEEGASDSQARALRVPEKEIVGSSGF